MSTSPIFDGLANNPQLRAVYPELKKASLYQSPLASPRMSPAQIYAAAEIIAVREIASADAQHLPDSLLLDIYRPAIPEGRITEILGVTDSHGLMSAADKPARFYTW